MPRRKEPVVNPFNQTQPEGAVPFLFLGVIAFLVVLGAFASSGSLLGNLSGRNDSLAALLGDVNADGKVDVFDLGILMGNYGKATTSDPNNQNLQRCDVKADGQIDIFDLGILASHYGQRETTTPTPTRPGIQEPTPTNGPTATTRPTPTAAGPTPTTPPQSGDCQRAFAATSPWNTPVSSNPTYHPKSSQMISTIPTPLTSDPTQYTYPYYEVTNTTPMKSLTLSGTFSNVTNNGSSLSNVHGTVSVPIPVGALASSGTDSQIIITNRDTGDTWGFWQADPNGDGTWHSVNGYHYNHNWSGVPPAGFVSRGAGLPYSAGLIRKCEIAQGHVDHAIAFAYNSPCSTSFCEGQGFPKFVNPPATKNDGSGAKTGNFPEGTRLQLNPTASAAQLNTWCGGNNTCIIVAKALQTYGMYTIDHSGSTKVYFEDNMTANWGTSVSRSTLSGIPLSEFRVVQW